MKKSLLALSLVLAFSGSVLAQTKTPPAGKPATDKTAEPTAKGDAKASAGKTGDVKPADTAPPAVPTNFDPKIASDPHATDGAKVAAKTPPTKNEKNAKASNDAMEIGRTQLAAGKEKDALEYLDRAIKLQPTNGEALLLRGQARVMRKLYPEATTDLTRAIKFMPQSPDVYFWRGRARQEQDKDKEAIKDFDKVIELKPDWADAWYWRGHSYSEMDMLKENACPDFAKAAELGSTLAAKSQKKYCK